MARNYSTRDYLRQLPGELLVRYFAGHAVLGEWDAAALAKDKRHALFESWLALPAGKRQAMDAESIDRVRDEITTGRAELDDGPLSTERAAADGREDRPERGPDGVLQAGPHAPERDALRLPAPAQSAERWPRRSRC